MGWFETRDLGQHWSVLILGELATSQRSVLLPDPHAHAHLLLGVDQGLFESWDDGQRWQQIIAVPGAVLALVAMQPAADQERVLLCATEQGLYRGQEQRGRIIWSQLSVPAVGSVTRLALNSDDSVLYALFGSDLWFSADQGRTWQRRWHFTRSDLIALVIDPQHPQEVLAGFFWPGLVMVSTDRGSSWRTLTS